VSAPLYHEVGKWARDEGLPLAVHLAESVEESRLLHDGTGGFADAWSKRGIPAPLPLGLSPVAFVDHYLGLVDTLCIHAVRVDAADIDVLFRRGASVAHCPLSNRAHGHGDAPLAAILAAKIPVGVGTDSVLSVGVLDLLASAREAGALAGLSAFDTLGMVWWSAASAIGFRDKLGMLIVGGQADIAVVTMPQDTPQPEEELLSGRGIVLATFVGGREVYRRANG
jgi:5-methylthioadenosine/S-adenosylhomocysteine deaminase